MSYLPAKLGVRAQAREGEAQPQATALRPEGSDLAAEGAGRRGALVRTYVRT